ncbi:hypothetical protein EWM64_g7146 [Hericium alpestre]|uniref:FAD dependent oxidoreductase domain-containing protein n=1 Tax=Hericium alpestre TaxID=135208 RepID=A0A4Y9ZQK2_9AGAM|nr:hypothetical protein EWM64_g7146 [Hericium alpestre]
MPTLSVPLNQRGKQQRVFERPTTRGPAPLPVSNPTRSFWIDSAPDANPLAKEGSTGALTEDADICIIGSGITGVSTAYHLAKAVETDPSLGPLKVVIVEARDFCSGATGRNGGHLAPNPFFDFDDSTASFGLDEAKKGIAIEHYTVDEILKIVLAEGLEDAVDLVLGGRTNIFLTEQERQSALAAFNAAKDAGLDPSDVEWFSQEEVEKRYGASYPAVRHNGGNLWPLKLVTQFFNLAKKTPGFSLHLHTNTPVTAISSLESGASRRWSVNTPRGSVSCSYVLHASNGYASHLLPHLTGPEGIVPVRGQIIAVRADADADAITTSGWTGNDHLEYWFPRPLKADEQEKNPLVILGGGREVAQRPFEFDQADDSELNEDVGRVLRDFLPGVFPGKFEVGKEPEMEWTGIMGFTKIGDPFVGPVLNPDNPADNSYQGQFISAGYSGHGMPRAFACAEAVAGMIIAELGHKAWAPPAWLPVHYLTTNRTQGGVARA